MSRKKSKRYEVKKQGKIYVVESILEQKFLRQWLKQHPQDVPKLQHIFHPTRAWRYDFWWPCAKVALEVQGYGPGHTSRDGMYNDANKGNASISMGYCVLYITSRHLTDTQIYKTCKFVKYVLEKRRETNP